MDEAKVRAAAEEHANATVAKDFKTAGSTLTKEAGAQAGGVMKAMPGELTGCAIKDVSSAGRRPSSRSPTRDRMAKRRSNPGGPRSTDGP